HRFAMQLLGADVAVALVEEQAGEREALAGRAQLDGLQAIERRAIGTRSGHGRDMGSGSTNRYGNLVTLPSRDNGQSAAFGRRHQFPVCSRSTSWPTVGTKPPA